MMQRPDRVMRLLVLAALAVCAAAAAAGEGQPRPGSGGNVAEAAAATDGIGLQALNWTIAHVSVGAQRYRIELRKNRIAVGGEGEAMSLFMRRAEAIVAHQGGGGYRILSYGEGLDSSLPLPQRVARGVVEIVP